MASSLMSLSFSSLRQSSRTSLRKPFPRIPQTCRCQRQQFHGSPIRRKESEEEENVEKSRPKGSKKKATKASDTANDDASYTLPPFSFDAAELEDTEQADFDRRSPSEQQSYIAEQRRLYEDYVRPDTQELLKRHMADAIRSAKREVMPSLNEPKRVKEGFFNGDEDQPELAGEDEEYGGDDITEQGHAELDRHREMRHYARIMAWEMPLLSKLAKPYTPPTSTQILRFRYTSYMGEENHPAASKIVLEFSTSDLPDLTPAQRVKFVKLVGPRYNPETDIVKMSCESFETQAQNKRYLGDLVETLLAEARDGKDMFEDVPLDFRHHKFVKKPMFPEGWKVSEERLKELEERRAERVGGEGKERMLLGSQGATAEGRVVVDGRSIVEQALANMPKEPVAVEMDPRGGRGGRGGGGGGRRMLR